MSDQSSNSSYDYRFDPGDQSLSEEDSIFNGIDIDQFAAFGSSSYTNRAPTRSLDMMNDEASYHSSSSVTAAGGVIQFCFEEDSLGARRGITNDASFCGGSFASSTPSIVGEENTSRISPMVHVDAAANESIVGQSTIDVSSTSRVHRYSTLFWVALMACTATLLAVEVYNGSPHLRFNLVDVPNAHEIAPDTEQEDAYYIDNDLPWAQDLTHGRELLNPGPKTSPITTTSNVEDAVQKSERHHLRTKRKPHTHT